MSDDWKPGDLALCVTNIYPPATRPSRKLRMGAVYTVTDTYIGTIKVNKEKVLALVFAEVRSAAKLGGWHHAAFRKINPHTPDAEDIETIDLLTRVPALTTAMEGEKA